MPTIRVIHTHTRAVHSTRPVHNSIAARESTDTKSADLCEDLQGKKSAAVELHVHYEGRLSDYYLRACVEYFSLFLAISTETATAKSFRLFQNLESAILFSCDRICLSTFKETSPSNTDNWDTLTN